MYIFMVKQAKSFSFNAKRLKRASRLSLKCVQDLDFQFIDPRVMSTGV